MTRWLLAVLLALGLVSAPRRATAMEAVADFAVIGDPQIGYGVGGVRGGAARFALLIDALNQARVPLVVIPGDLVETRSLFEHWAFERTLRGLDAKVLLAAGNHDVVDLASLSDFRRRYGKDYYVHDAPGARLVVVDSETARSATISRAEFDRQWAFLERALPDTGPAVGVGTFVVTHRPPFLAREDENESHANWPAGTRARLLSLCRRAGVSAILAGHLHRDHLTRTHDGIEVRMLCGSARCFDQAPIGFTRYQGSSPRTVVVAPPPPKPVSMPYLRDWTPRIFDFSWRHWLLTLLYAGAGWLSLRAARADRSPRPSPFAWVAILLFFFAVNMQLDFDEMLREIGRIAARRTGVAHVRHTLSPIILGLAGLVVGVHGMRRFRAGVTGREATALVMCLVPIAWFSLSMISHHDIGMLFDELVWDGLTLLSLLVLAWAAVTQLRLNLRR